MLQAFKAHIQVKRWFKPKDRLLLAISGGVDSVVLAHLLKHSGLNFSLAHCNFNLRGKDSLADETFCRKLAVELEVPFYVTWLDAKTFAKKNKLSLQMAARQLRYAWFDQLLAEQQMDYLLTAHNASDAVETLFINLLRGTGIKGLKSIPEKTGRTLRPLLPFTKTEIVSYAKAEGIKHRTDKSNQETKYERNFLRLRVLPLLRELNPAMEQVMLNNLRNFGQEAALLQETLAERSQRWLEQRQGFIYVNKIALQNDPYCRLLLHHLLGPYGFNPSQLGDIEAHLQRKGLAGKILLSPSHTLTIDRQHLVLKAHTVAENRELSLNSLKDLSALDFIQVQRLPAFVRPAAHELVVDSDLLVFPLRIRGKARGDRFRPFGMKGFKLLSDFLKDQKLNNFEKESCKLLVNGNGEIIWVMGYRSDERYRVSAGSGNLIKLSLIGR